MSDSVFSDDAMAIVGVACRLPGGIDSVDQLWTALIGGRDLVTSVPADRFDPAQTTDTSGQRPGKSYTAAGGFLDNIAGFDTEYFDVISPREATRIDPQQRLLLEMVVEACDDAGLPPDGLAGSDTGVFVGASTHDYSDLQTADLRSMNAHTMIGMSLTNVANRLSYVFDLHGPSITMDTACSSGLTAVHNACEYLRHHESTGAMAIAGGINLILNPATYVGFSAASMLSPTGRCRPFSADADGYVRSEGGGVILLKRLSDAVADGDRVHAVIVGTGAGSDGRTSGLALPSATAQEALLREVYDKAGVSRDDVAYVEAHGTGTAAGDPVESRAIGRALGQGRAGALPVGSVKSNIGHLEAGAGIAGLLKAILVLRHRMIPALLHAETLNPDIDFADLGIEPITEHRELGGSERAVVGVNSFGFGGSNAHVALTAPPATAASSDSPVPAGAVPVLVSARSEKALADAALRMADRLETIEPEQLYDLAYTSCRRRGTYEWRTAVMATEPLTAAASLRELITETQPPLGTATRKATKTGKTALVFCGNGAQWIGMGAELLRSEPAFAAAVREVDGHVQAMAGWSVWEELTCAPENSRMRQTEIAQPTLFAVQVGLAALLGHYGVRPAAVVGHSVGEIAAAYVAGALDLPSATRVIVERCRLQAATAGKGTMAAVGIGAEEAEEILDEYVGRLELGALNSAQDVTISGDHDALRELGERMAARGTFFRLLDFDIPFHSRHIEPLAGPLRDALVDVHPRQARIPFVSTVTGGLLDSAQMDGDYWWRELRQPVLFAPAIEALLDLGIEVLVDVGPHPVLSTYLRRLTAGRDETTAVVSTLVRKQDGVAAFQTALAGLVASSAALDWEMLLPKTGRIVDLPAYPWQRENYWNGDPTWWLRNSGGGVSEHPLLGERAPILEPTWQQIVDTARVPWLLDHKLDDAVVMAGAAYMEMALAAGRLVHEDKPVEVNGLDIDRAMVVPSADDDVQLRKQVSLAADGMLRIASQAGPDARWQEHVHGRVRRLLAPAPHSIDIGAINARMERNYDIGTRYAEMARAGVGYGPSFEVIEELRSGTAETIAAYQVDESWDGYGVHPVLFDGALQAGSPLLLSDSLFLPATIDALRVWRQPDATGVVWVQGREAGARTACWDIVIADQDGRVAAQLEGVHLRRFDGNAGEPVRSYTTVLRASDTFADLTTSPIGASVAELAAAGVADRARLRAGWDAERYRASVRQFKTYTGHFAARAFAELTAGAETFGVGELLAAGVQPGYEPLLPVLAGAAEAAGLLQSVDQRRWRAIGEPDPEAAWQQMVRDFPENSAETLVNGRCGWYLPEILLGQRDPLEILFADTDRQFVEAIYSDGPAIRLLGEYARTLVAGLVTEWPADRPLRILEVGAGGGGLTATLLPVLPAERTHYVYTDVSQSFFPRAQQRFADVDFLEYRVFDIDRDLAEQDYAPGAFDLVIAHNVLHASQDLRATLGRVRELLTGGGQLLLFESHDIEILAPCFGLLDSFWNYTDTDLRPNWPLLTAAQWPEILAECGFGSTAQVGHEDDATGGDYSIMLASRDKVAEGAPRSLAPASREKDEQWIVAGGEPGNPLVKAVYAELVASGLDVGKPVAARAAVEEWRALLPNDGVHRHVVLLAGTAAEEQLDTTDFVVVRAGILRALVDACAHFTADAQVTCWIVTRPTGVFPGPESPAMPRDAALWGLARSVASEQPRMRIRRISLDAGEPVRTARRLTAELLRGDEEDEVVLTTGGRFVPRVVPRESHAGFEKSTGPYHLEVQEPSLSYRVDWTAADLPEIGHDEVLIDVRAAALNYRDVMVSAGLIPPDLESETATGNRLGQECAGVIAAVGSEVTDYAPGDRVLALAHLSIANYAVVPAVQIARMPEAMSFAAAATMPAVFFTAHYGLNFLAHLQPGETILVHGGAGGVGLATLQIARARGANVIVTAGTPAKRDLLRLLGVEHILDSRSLEFAERVKQITDGRGVDIVLNSLAGEAIDRGLEVLAPGGRFIELGKRDIQADSPLSMRRFAKNLSLFAFDAHTSFGHQPRLARAQWAEVAALIADGTYVPLLHQTYPASRVRDAMKALQHSKHIGKLVVVFDQRPAVHTTPPPLRLDPAGTYLVTGGLGGFGAATARWLAECGARALALVSRRGDQSPEAGELLDALTARGVKATAYSADVANLEQMREVIAAIDGGGHPLRGVVHAAMVLDDAKLTDLSDERLRSMVLPKIRGAVVLDRLTHDHRLDMFVMYSSVAALVGNQAQSAYGAGNLFLEALARARRASGRPGTTAAWGSIVDAGYVARRGLVDSITNVGLNPVESSEALRALGELLNDEVEVAAVGRFDWGRLADYLPNMVAPRLQAVLPERTASDGGTQIDIRQQLAKASEEEAQALVVQELTKLVAKVLQTSPDRVDAGRRLDLLGMDSLMAAELVSTMHRSLGCDIPAVEVISSGGITDLSHRVLSQIRP